MTRENVLEIYDSVIEECERFRRKGKTMPYTSANGHMFSQVNKNGQLGIRFSKDVQEKYINELNTDYFKSYGATMKGYVLIPDEVLKNREQLKDMLNEGYDYVLTLEPK